MTCGEKVSEKEYIELQKYALGIWMFRLSKIKVTERMPQKEGEEDEIMLLSIAMILLVGMSMGWICKKIHLPSLLGMIVTGIVLGPHALNLIDGSILNISSELGRIALIIILTRAGLSLDFNDLKKVGRPAVLMCFAGSKSAWDFDFGCGDHGSGCRRSFSCGYCSENAEVDGGRVWCETGDPADDSCWCVS